jgi:hypothetical protein
MRGLLFRKKGTMVSVDAMYLYRLGHAIHPLIELRSEADMAAWILPLYVAQNSLDGLLTGSVYQLRSSYPAGAKLLQAIKALTVDPERTRPIEFMEAYGVSAAAGEFEHVLAAEFGVTGLYLVQKIRGYDMSDMVSSGIVLFPPDLPAKIPEAIPDINQATRCIAWGLPTAAGFHLHRANESVLHRWYDAVSGGADRPKGRNIGDYLAVLNTGNFGSLRIRSALKDLKDLHRNPLIHPDDSLESVDEAIALLGSIQAVVVAMLKDIGQPDLTLPAGVE